MLAIVALERSYFQGFRARRQYGEMNWVNTTQKKMLAGEKKQNLFANRSVARSESCQGFNPRHE